MFEYIKIVENTLFFRIDKVDYFLPSMEEEKEIIKKITTVNNGLIKVNKLFHHIMNTKFVMQDLIDYHMDKEIDWNFINLCLRSSKKLKRFS